jgi:hypothetical protein
VKTPGYYTYYESIAEGDFVVATKTPCADTSETTIVTGTPKVQTAVSAQRTRPGASITDKILVSGTGVLSLSVQAALYGPFATHGAISCSGTPLWKGTIATKGDGTYTTAAVKLASAGYYTYRETCDPGIEALHGVRRDRRDDVRVRPADGNDLTSARSSSQGGRSSTRQVGGLGRRRIAVELFGLFPRARRSPLIAPVRLHRDHGTARTLRTPSFRLAKVGFTLPGACSSPLVAEVTTQCALSRNVPGGGDHRAATISSASARRRQ